jgi:hypothetical protein
MYEFAATDVFCRWFCKHLEQFKGFFPLNLQPWLQKKPVISFLYIRTIDVLVLALHQCDDGMSIQLLDFLVF